MLLNSLDTHHSIFSNNGNLIIHTTNPEDFSDFVGVEVLYNASRLIQCQDGIDVALDQLGANFPEALENMTVRELSVIIVNSFVATLEGYEFYLALDEQNQVFSSFELNEDGNPYTIRQEVTEAGAEVLKALMLGLIDGEPLDLPAAQDVFLNAMAPVNI